ncbi:MAG TPA: M28 family peptidase [Saprospiraceae bacterium]|nr:M28 family peptidase [Saprospiraceae bacterium]
MQTRYKIFFFSLMIISGCAREAVLDTGFDLAASTASEVNETMLWSQLEMVASSHTDDVKLDNEGYESSEEFPSASLSRDAATGVILRALTDMGYDADTVVLSGEDAHLAYNIVAEYPGTTKSEEVVLIGVHHDAFYTGADDNSSAVAGMLEMARVIRHHTFTRTIRLVSFDLEDFGSIGSTRFVEAGYADDVVAAIVMDMIGYASDQPGSQKDVVGIRLPDIGDFLFVIGNESSGEMTQQMVAMSNAHDIAKVLGVIAPGDGAYFLSSAFMRSDHALLWFNGIPAVFLTDGANFRNPYYHTPEDTPDKLDPVFLANNTRLLTAAVALFAERNP